MALQINERVVDDVTVIHLIGRLDSATVAQCEDRMIERIPQPNAKILIDLTELGFVSSAGLRVILMMAKRIRQANGHLVLCGLQPNVNEVFRISGFLKILDVMGSLEIALNRFAENLM